MKIAYDIYSAGRCRQSERFVIRDGGKDRVSFPALCYVLHHPQKGPILFDTGFSYKFTQNCRRFPDLFYNLLIPVEMTAVDDLAVQIKKHAGLEARDIRTIILSHFHIDHMASLCDFPNAQIICSRTAYNSVRNLGNLRGILHAFLPRLLPPDFVGRARFVEDTPRQALSDAMAPFRQGFDILGDGSIMAIPLPGHAAGQFGTIFDAIDGKKTFLVADACWSSRSYRENIMPHPLTRLIQHDWSAYRETLYRLHRLHLNQPDMAIIPSHCREVPYAA